MFITDYRGSHKSPRDEAHSHLEKPEQVAEPEVHEDAGSLCSVQPQPPHYPPVPGVWSHSYRGRFLHLPEKRAASETVKHHQGDQLVAEQSPPDAISPNTPGRYFIKVTGVSVRQNFMFGNNM